MFGALGLPAYVLEARLLTTYTHSPRFYFFFRAGQVIEAVKDATFTGGPAKFEVMQPFASMSFRGVSPTGQVLGVIWEPIALL